MIIQAVACTVLTLTTSAEPQQITDYKGAWPKREFVDIQDWITQGKLTPLTEEEYNKLPKKTRENSVSNQHLTTEDGSKEVKRILVEQPDEKHSPWEDVAVDSAAELNELVRGDPLPDVFRNAEVLEVRTFQSKLAKKKSREQRIESILKGLQTGIRTNLRDNVLFDGHYGKIRTADGRTFIIRSGYDLHQLYHAGGVLYLREKKSPAVELQMIEAEKEYERRQEIRRQMKGPGIYTVTEDGKVIEYSDGGTEPGDD